MHVVRAFVGVDHLEVHQVARDAELVADAVAAQHVARHAGDVQRLAAGVALHDRGDLDRRRALVLHAAQAQAALQAERDLGLHVGQLLLHQLVGGQRLAELLAVEHVLARAVPAVLGRAERAPGDAVARAVQAGERALQAAHLGEGVLLGAEHLVHHDLAGDRGAQADLAVDRRRATGPCSPSRGRSRGSRLRRPWPRPRTRRRSGELVIHILLPRERVAAGDLAARA